MTKTINLHDDNYDDNIEVYFMINIERMEKHLLKIFQLTFTLFFLIFWDMTQSNLSLYGLTPDFLFSSDNNWLVMIRSQAREQGLAWMLFCVVAVFFFCNLLALVVNILEVGLVASAGQINLGLAALLFSFILFKVLSQQKDFSPLKQYFLATWSQDFKWSIIYFE